MSDDNFITIGKMIMHSPLNVKWKIPPFHFIVNRTPSGLFEAINIELILVSPGNTLEESVEGLFDLTMHHINAVMDEGRGFDEFIESVDTSAMDEYWREYRKLDFTLSKDGRSLSLEVTRKINEAIANRLAKELEQQEQQLEEIKQQITEMKQQFTDVMTHIAKINEKSIASRRIITGVTVEVLEGKGAA